MCPQAAVSKICIFSGKSVAIPWSRGEGQGRSVIYIIESIMENDPLVGKTRRSCTLATGQFVASQHQIYAF